MKGSVQSGQLANKLTKKFQREQKHKAKLFSFLFSDQLVADCGRGSFDQSQGLGSSFCFGGGALPGRRRDPDCIPIEAAPFRFLSWFLRLSICFVNLTSLRILYLFGESGRVHILSARPSSQWSLLWPKKMSWMLLDYNQSKCIKAVSLQIAFRSSFEVTLLCLVMLARCLCQAARSRSRSPRSLPNREVSSSSRAQCQDTEKPKYDLPRYHLNVLKMHFCYSFYHPHLVQSSHCVLYSCLVLVCLALLCRALLCREFLSSSSHSGFVLIPSKCTKA